MSETDADALERRLPEDLPGEIKREILAGDYDDPIWYAGRLGLSVQDALDATPTQLAQLRAMAGMGNGASNGNGNGNGKHPALTRRDRRPAAEPD